MRAFDNASIEAVVVLPCRSFFGKIELSHCLLRRDISLLEVFFLDLGVNLLQNEFEGFFKFGNVSHFEFGTISQEAAHVTISKKSLDGSHFNNIRVDNFSHVLSSDSGGDANTATGDLIPDPGLSGPRGDSGNDSDNGEDGDGGDDGFGDGRRSFVVNFFRR